MKYSGLFIVSKQKSGACWNEAGKTDSLRVTVPHRRGKYRRQVLSDACIFRIHNSKADPLFKRERARKCCEKILKIEWLIF